MPPKRKYTVIEAENDARTKSAKTLRPSRSSHYGDQDTDSLAVDSPSRRSSNRVNLRPRSEEATLDVPGGDDTNGHAGPTRSQITTPSRTPRGRPRKNGTTPRGKVLFATPVKGDADGSLTASRIRNADRSARRKSNRALVRNVVGDGSDEDDEDELAHQINGSNDSGSDIDHDELEKQAEKMTDQVATPSKKPRGRKPRQRTPSPEARRDLPPHEEYFFQNRSTKNKTSNAVLSSLALLDHEEYFSLLRKHEEPHAKEMKHLYELHARSFSQWDFEMQQGFSVCLYGWGSKRSLLLDFADHIYKLHSNSKVVVINGYVDTLSIKDVLNTVAAAMAETSVKLGSQPPAMLDSLMTLLDQDVSKQVVLIIHSIDRPPLRRLASQSILAQLSAHPKIRLLASADHPLFPLLWDSSLRTSFNFVFHDCTTFQPFAVETDVLYDVHELLGRSGRRVGGKEGVSFVLKSLNDNSRNLFRVLIHEQLAFMDANGGHDPDDDAEAMIGAPARRQEPGVEYRVLYHKAVQEFICSNEMNFRTLLKE